MKKQDFKIMEIVANELQIPLCNIDYEFKIIEGLSKTKMPDFSLMNILCEIQIQIGLYIDMNDDNFCKIKTIRDLINYIKYMFKIEKISQLEFAPILRRDVRMIFN